MNNIIISFYYYVSVLIKHVHPNEKLAHVFNLYRLLIN